MKRFYVNVPSIFGRLEKEAEATEIFVDNSSLSPNSQMDPGNYEVRDCALKFSGGVEIDTFEYYANGIHRAQIETDIEKINKVCDGYVENYLRGKGAVLGDIETRKEKWIYLGFLEKDGKYIFRYIDENDFEEK